MNVKKHLNDLKLLGSYMDYWVDHYPKMPVTFERFKERHQAKKTHEIRQEIAINAKKKCFYCQLYTEGEHTIDHIVPLSRGGKNVAENKVYSCERCNNLKADYLLSQFLRFLEKELKKKTRRGEMYSLDQKTIQIMMANIKKLIKAKQPIMHKISEYESMI